MMSSYPHHVSSICISCKKWIPKNGKITTPLCVRYKNIPHFDFEFNSLWFGSENWCLCDFEVATVKKEMPTQEETFLAKVKKKVKKNKVKNG